MLTTYQTMIPAYMKEDEQFSEVYKNIEAIFGQIEETCKNMLKDMQFNINSAEFLKVLSLFGQSTTFKDNVYRAIGLQFTEEETETGPVMKWLIRLSDDKEDVDISLSGFSLYFSAKFNTLKNNFNGTFKNLKESLSKAFNVKDTYMTIDCKQSIETDDEDIEHPFILLTVSLSPELQKMFPPVEAYIEGEVPWIIDNIDPTWIAESEANTKQYNFYKSFLDFITLFQNGYYKLNILGVVTDFEIAENAPVLKWGHSNWNEAVWSDSVVEEE